ncbi:MAG: AraC family transcriptional regulator [Clostridia bacterium]|nr:AraC family transcriptional regulator [Clostridia bacterium]
MRKEFFNTKKHKTDLYMVNCGYEDCCPNFVCAPHMRKYYLIHYVTKGNGYYEVNGEKYSVGEGEIFVIYPNELITYYSPDINNTWSFCWIGFSGNGADEYFRLTGIDGYTKKIENLEFYSVISNCLNYIGENTGSISQLKLNAYTLNALDALKKIKSDKRVSAVEQADRAVRYIEYNYMNAITAKDVSTYLNIERSHFYRLFKKYTGSSPEQYIINYRIKRACELINCGRYSVSEIARFVGICDIYYFSRLFKKITGKSPSEYRKLHN